MKITENREPLHLHYLGIFTKLRVTHIGVAGTHLGGELLEGILQRDHDGHRVGFLGVSIDTDIVYQSVCL